MRIAITADCHLESDKPERKNILQDIFKKCAEEGIPTLFILGDLFDKASQNYSEFDVILKQFPNISVYLIAGNHDYNISQRHFTADNITVLSQAQFVTIENLDFLFIPYQNTIMDEVVAKMFKDKKAENWILVSHGDYLTTTASYLLNTYEGEKFYMPLSASTVEKFRPIKVFLGHIHKPSEFGKVIYAGSPCPVDKNETGKRSFLIFDTTQLEYERIYLDTPYIYFREEIVVYPIDELNYLKQTLENMIYKWKEKEKLSDEDIVKVELTLKICGYSNDIGKLKSQVEKFFNDRNIKVYIEETEKVGVVDTDDKFFTDRKEIFERIMKGGRIPGEVDGIKISEDLVKREILRLVFGENRSGE
jgi:DNA repair protein SbcD/Mre11